MYAIRYNNSECVRIKAAAAYLTYMGYDRFIDSIYDRKGELEVSWAITPTESQMNDVADIWIDLFAEPYTLHLIFPDVELKRIYKRK